MEKTTFQKMDELEKREFIQRFINLACCSERSFKVLEHWVEQEELMCKENHIKLQKLYP